MDYPRLTNGKREKMESTTKIFDARAELVSGERVYISAIALFVDGNLSRYEVAIATGCRSWIFETSFDSEAEAVQFGKLAQAVVARMGADAIALFAELSPVAAEQQGLNPADDPHPLWMESPKYAAVSAHEFITLDGVEFYVWRLHWADGAVEYKVFEPIASTFGDHSSQTHADGRLWGEVTSYFPQDRFAHLAYGSNERRDQVAGYKETQQAVADQIAELAFPYDVRDTHVIKNGRRYQLDTDHRWFTANA